MYSLAALFLEWTLTLCSMLFLSLVLLFMISQREPVHEERYVLVAPVQNEAGEDNCYERFYVHGKLFHIQQPTSSPGDLG